MVDLFFGGAFHIIKMRMDFLPKLANDISVKTEPISMCIQKPYFLCIIPEHV